MCHSHEYSSFRAGTAAVVVIGVVSLQVEVCCPSNYGDYDVGIGLCKE